MANANNMKGQKILAITPGASDLVPRPLALYIGGFGTIDVTNEDGTTQSAMPVIEGSTLDIQPKKLTAVGGAASVFGLYKNPLN